MKKKKLLLSIMMLVQASLLLIVISYAWFSDKSNPSISENNIKVTSAEGLVIKLQPDSEARTSVNLNEILGDIKDFELKQMSSADANRFYTIDFGAGLGHNQPRYVAIEPDSSGTMNMEKYGCIDYNFYLQTENFAKHVYFHKDTSLKGFGADALRVAITVKDGTNDIQYIFGTTKENGVSAPFTTQAIVKSGEFQYNNVDPSFYSNQVVYGFDDRNGGRGSSDDDPIDLTKVLLTIPANSTTTVNVKIWLEGGDQECNNELSNSTVDVLLKFGSANVLRDAPNVFANNALRTITNLTTEMEYAYTNKADTVWTSVTDPAMKFDRGTTVYIRYKEVPGVSPYSYATGVVFNG